ncbi:MAG: hypothetical protein WBV94_05615 [Blastocatellia bacterium]
MENMNRIKSNLKRAGRIGPSPIVFEEYAAPSISTATALLKFLAVLSLLGGVVLCVSGISNQNTLLAAFGFTNGLLSFALLIAVALILESLSALTKNAAHLAGIRALNTDQLTVLQQQSEKETIS